MVLLAQGAMFWCFFFRLVLQFQSFENKSMKSIRMYRVILWIISLPIVMIFYLMDISIYFIDWTPGTWAIRPMPVTFFLVWIIVLLTDSLYQFHMISKIPKSNT